jgi:GMP synthase-like glutamine amidotransferase
MSVLVCKNITSEGPGTIEDYLKAEEIPYRIIDLSLGEEIPNPKAYDFLIMMGGPMSVNESDAYPYIKTEEALTRQFIEQGKGVLGICLGAQIMAKALGAQVYRGSQREIGWLDITLTPDGLIDPIIRPYATSPIDGNLSQKLKVFQWHGETFDIPNGAVRLAGSPLYPNQAFRYGPRAYALQFHIEVTKEMVYDWLKDEDIDHDRLREETQELYDEYHRRAWNLYQCLFLVQ